MEKEKFFVGLQSHPINFVDEEVDQVIEDTLKGGINAHLIMGNYGSSDKWRPLKMPMRHSKKRKEYDLYGGFYIDVHEEFYRATNFKPMKTPEPELNKIDIFDRVIPKAHAAGQEVYVYLTEDATFLYPGYTSIAGIDAHGHIRDMPCVNNPDYFYHLMAMVEDFTKSYDLDGVFLNWERSGFSGFSPLNDLMNAKAPICFCPHCRRRAKEMGFDLERAKQGCQKLVALMNNDDINPRLYSKKLYLTFCEYPEIFQLQRMWQENSFRISEEAYSIVKRFKPNMKVGMNQWPKPSVDFNRLADNVDWIKPLTYPLIDGYWYAEQFKKWQHTALRNYKKDVALYVFYEICGIESIGIPDNIDDIIRDGFPFDFASAMNSRLIDEVDGKCKIYPNVEIGIEFEPGVHPVLDYNNEENLKKQIVGLTEQVLKLPVDGMVVAAFYECMRKEDMWLVGDLLEKAGKIKR